ncbi:SDR family oxidoreductase [Terasakiella pusilla]|jgi:nucleoside-diphosphate-sugar epimerase|uniref:SDR family oxidoreductase n=1 Tax=Terasakiella pusilla TaxID=64973 RepID=UPI003AA861E2
MNTLFVFGLGYSARFFAKQAVAKGWRVMGTMREPQEIDGIEVFPFDGKTHFEDFAGRLEGVTHVLHSIPPHKDLGDPLYNLQRKHFARLKKLQWFGYLSTTGVYGNADGAMVDETFERTPSSPRSIARKEAEDAWLGTGLPVHIFRLAGIYGPGRSTFDQIRQGRARAIDKPGHVFSRIHRDDIAGVLWASIAHPQPQTAYNVCDDQPAEPLKVLREACRIMGHEMPPVQSFEEAVETMSDMARTFWLDNKKVDNSRVKEALGYELMYPGFKEGLEAIWAEEDHHDH